MKLPVDVIGQLNNEEMVFVCGGFDGNFNGINNSNGVCDGTNNGDGRCQGVNNGNGLCGKTKD